MRVAVAGASGVIGAGAVEAFARAGCEVIALSRRAPVLPSDVAFRHVALDLTDAGRCAQVVREIGPVSHFVHAAVAEAPGLVAGWSDPELIALNAAMFEHIARPLAESGHLRWAGIMQGTKAYGAHLHPISVPARESSPRDPHPNFYWKHEDCLRELAARHGFGWSIFRPQVVFGGAPGAVMNPVAALGAYAALCRELGEPFAWPGAMPLVWEATDTLLLGEALVWAAGEPRAAGEIFNLTNGDVFVLAHDWPRLADALGLEAALARQGGIASFLESERARAAWRDLAARHGLAVSDLSALVGQSHHYVDLLCDDSVVRAGGLPVLVSGIRIRKAGFAQCRDTLESLLFWLDRMVETRLLPPMPAREN